MANKHFIGLVQAILSSAEAALGEADSPMARHLQRDGALARRTAEKSLELLIMLQEKTRGNLEASELTALLDAQAAIRKRLVPEAERC